MTDTRLDLGVKADADGKIDEAVNAELNGAAKVEKENMDANQDAAASDAGDAELNSYSQLNYDLP